MIKSRAIVFCLSFLTVKQVMDMWENELVDKEMVEFFLCDRFKMVANKHFMVEDSPRKRIKTDNEGTWDRIFNSDSLPERILENRFLPPRLKSRIYLGVKNNTPSLLKYYYEHYDLVKKNGIKTIRITQHAVTYLFGKAPTTLDDRAMSVEMGALMIRKASSGVLVCIVYASGEVEIVDNPDNRDLEFLLPRPDFFSTVYNAISPSNKRKAGHHEYRRAKVRRRLFAG